MSQQFRRFLGKYRIPVLLTVIVVAAGGIFMILRNLPIPATGGKTIPVDVSATTGQGSVDVIDSGETYLPVQLSEGKPQPQAVESVRLATGEPLTADEVERILSRLPSLPSQPELQTDFKLAQQPIPPPRTGETITEPFPPHPETIRPGQVASGPLEVLRYAPQGEIPVAPFVSITFNQPMVPLATLEDLAAEDVPVRIEPALSGTWRWLGTRTLTFEYDSELIDRLPKATEYRASVPAGTRSAVGGVLAQSVEWTFSTPPPKMTSSYPYNEPQPLEPLFFIAFDQRIDPVAVLETIQVNAGGRDVELQLASDKDIRVDERVKGLVKNTPEGRWLAFQAKEPLPQDAPVSVMVGPGTPSAEGPLVTQEAQTYSFYTYAPLRIVEHRCTWSAEECPPLTPFFIRFNNPIDVQVYEESMLTIEPDLPGASVNIYGDTINIQGATKGQTTYTVVVDGDIQDIFGQKLGKDARLTFRVGRAEPRLIGPGETFVTLDPAADKPVFSVYTINYSKLDVKIYAVQPSDWTDFKRYLREFARTDIQVKVPGRLVMDKSLPVEAPADALTEVDIDLSDLMDGDFGHFVVIVQPPRGLFQSQDELYWQTVQAWVQVTQIGLDAFVDHSEMVVWTTALKDGAPLAGVTITAQQGGTETVTMQDGTARFSIPDGASYLVASQGADRALLPRSPYAWDEEGWNRLPPADQLRWYVFDDRQMYRPGEEVHIKGWLRRVGGKQDGDVGLVGKAVTAVRYRIIDPQGNDLLSGQSEVNALGGFDFAFTLPEAVNLGYAQLVLDPEGSLDGFLWHQTYYHNFQIQEFRRPEFEVNARNESLGPYFAGEDAVVAVEAKYYAGDPLTNAEVSWLVTSTPSSYSPPNWPDFTFGTWQPWWWFYEPVFRGEAYADYGGGTSETFSGVTDASGTHYLMR